MSNFIYHYTTINTLALMFSNKTLRLNGLSNVDDMEEGHADIFGDMSKYVFVSSWTRDEEENIALWNMYTPNMKGVRIGIDPAKVRLEYGVDKQIININSRNQILAYKNGEFLSGVEYVSDPRVTLFDKSGSINRRTIANLGRYKRDVWSFQKEVRFVLMALSFSKFLRSDLISLENMFFEKILHKEESEINFVDLNLNDEVWINAEILLGPNTDISDKRIVGSLIKTYCANSQIKVKKSNIKIRSKKF